MIRILVQDRSDSHKEKILVLDMKGRSRLDIANYVEKFHSKFHIVSYEA